MTRNLTSCAIKDCKNSLKSLVKDLGSIVLLPQRFKMAQSFFRGSRPPIFTVLPVRFFVRHQSNRAPRFSCWLHAFKLSRIELRFKSLALFPVEGASEFWELFVSGERSAQTQEAQRASTKIARGRATSGSETPGYHVLRMPFPLPPSNTGLHQATKREGDKRRHGGGQARAPCMKPRLF